MTYVFLGNIDSTVHSHYQGGQLIFLIKTKLRPISLYKYLTLMAEEINMIFTQRVPLKSEFLTLVSLLTLHINIKSSLSTPNGLGLLRIYTFFTKYKFICL